MYKIRKTIMRWVEAYFFRRRNLSIVALTAINTKSYNMIYYV